MGYTYKIKIYKKKLSIQTLTEFLDNLQKIANVREYIIDIEHNKLVWQIESSQEVVFNNDLLFPFKLIKDEVTTTANSKTKFFIPFINKKKISTLLRDMHLKKKEVTSINLKTLPYNISIKKYLIGQIHFKNGEYKSIIIKDIVNFLDLGDEDNIKFESVSAEPQRNKIFIESKNPILTSENGTIGVDNFDFNRHSFIIGQSGSGKSKFIELITNNIIEEDKKEEYCVVIIDPHNNIFPEKGIEKSIKVNFKETTLDLYTNAGDPLTSTELNIDLFSSLLDTKNNYHLYRVLKHSLFLLYSIKEMSLENLKRLLVDLLYRKELLKKTNNIAVKDFFELEFSEVEVKRYTEAILPILNLISEFSLINSNSSTNLKLNEIIERYKLINLTPSVTKLGARVTKLIAGSIIQQIFILAQSKNIGNKKVILIIDEVSIVENPSLVKILSEARKFNLSVYLTCQYTNQLSSELKYGIISNIVNYFCFKVSKGDAEMLLDNINIRFNPNSIRGKKFEEIKDEEVRLLTNLNPRNLIVRIMKDEKFLFPALMKTKNI